MVRVQEQMPLQPKHPVEEEREDGAEDERDLRVGLPRLFAETVDVEETEEAALHRAEPAKPVACTEAVVVVDARHIDAHRVAEGDEDDDVDEDLADSLPAHLEPLPAEERVDEVREHHERDREPERV